MAQLEAGFGPPLSFHFQRRDAEDAEFAENNERGGWQTKRTA